MSLPGKLLFISEQDRLLLRAIPHVDHENSYIPSSGRLLRFKGSFRQGKKYHQVPPGKPRARDAILGSTDAVTQEVNMHDVPGPFGLSSLTFIYRCTLGTLSKGCSLELKRGQRIQRYPHSFLCPLHCHQWLAHLGF